MSVAGSPGDPIVVVHTCRLYGQQWSTAESFDDVSCGDPNNDIIVGLISDPGIANDIDHKVMAIAIHHYHKYITELVLEQQNVTWRWHFVFFGLMIFAGIKVTLPLLLFSSRTKSE